MLDDSVMFAKRLRNIDQPVTLCVVDDLPHGFLSLSQLSRETREAANVCVERIRAVFTQSDTPPEPRKHRKLERTDRGVSASSGEAGTLCVGPIEGVELTAGKGAKIADGEGLVAVAGQNNTDSGGPWIRFEKEKTAVTQGVKRERENESQTDLGSATPKRERGSILKKKKKKQKARGRWVF